MDNTSRCNDTIDKLFFVFLKFPGQEHEDICEGLVTRYCPEDRKEDVILVRQRRAFAPSCYANDNIFNGRN